MNIKMNKRIESQNKRDRWHWRKRHADMKDWQTRILYGIGGKKNPPAHKRGLHIVSHRARFIDDKSNLVGGAKGLVDAIVSAGLLKDDSDEWAEITYEQKKCKRVDEFTEIIIDG